MPFALAACKPEQKVVAQPQPVQVMRVETRAGTQQWSYTGIVRARFETDQAFRVAGKVIERKVDIGQRVLAGQVLARLDATDLALALQSAEAEVMAARSSREQAVAAEGRFTTLHQQGHVAKAALDTRVAAADEARARADRAERSLALARNQLAYAELKAEHAGAVTSLAMEVGQVVAVGQPVARIARLDALEAQVAVPEQMLQAVQSAAAEVEIWGTTAKRYPASLRELSPEADRISRTYQARFGLSDPEPQVMLGRTATVHLAASARSASFQLPLSAVMSDGSGAAVWRLTADGTRVERTPVVLSAISAEHAFVSGGLAAGDRIVTLGVHMLDASKPVRVVVQQAQLR